MPENLSADEVIQSEILKGLGTYTVGPVNVDHVIGLVINDVMRDNGPLARLVRARVEKSYDFFK